MKNYKLSPPRRDPAVAGQITNYKLLLVGLALSLFTVGCSLPWQKQISPGNDKVQEEARKMVTLKITDNDDKTYDYPIEYQENLTAFDLFKWAGIQVATKQYDFGVYVDAIQGIKGEKGFYWIYYLNGQPAMEAADKYMMKSGDVIEWKYEAEKAGL